MFNRNTKKWFISVMLFFNVAMAQQEGIQLGSSLTLFPTVGLSYGHDDNVFYTGIDSERLSSNFYVFSPGIRLEGESERSNFLAQFDYNRTHFNSDSDYDFEMRHFLLGLGHNVSNRSRLELSAEYYDGTDRIGTGNQQGAILALGLDPDEWHSTGVAGSWHYGGVGAKGSIDIELGMIDRQYDNNREYTATRDRETRYIGLTYAHQVSPKTNYLAQVKRTNIDYDTATLDNSETRMMLGAEWKATGKTSARALVGYLSKNFENDSLHEDFSGVAVEAGLTWSPRSYSVFDLTLTRETDETNGNGSYRLRNSADLGWTHYWQNRFSTTANIGYSREDYKDSLRDDRLNYYGVSAKYQFTDWLLSGLGYRYTDRTSSYDDFEYTDNSILFTLELAK